MKRMISTTIRLAGSRFGSRATRQPMSVARTESSAQGGAAAIPQSSICGLMKEIQ